MTIGESLMCITKINIDDIIKKVCIDRGLDSSMDYDATWKDSISYQLAKADIFMELYSIADIREQDITITLPQRAYFFDQAQKIYSKYEETSFTGEVYGFTGTKFNKVR